MADRGGNQNATTWWWTSKHWWSSRFELRNNGRVAALVHVKTSTGTAEVGDNRYALKRFRLPPYITIRDTATNDLLARFCLIPKHGFLAEFGDGRSFRLGWTNWWRHDWNWTDDAGRTVLLSKHRWLGGCHHVWLGPDAPPDWPLLAVLELAISKVGIPLF